MPSPDEPERLDRFLVRMGWAQSRRLARELIASGRVRIGGRHLRKGEMVDPNGAVEIAGTVLSNAITPNFDFALEILFEDPDVLVVNKPAPYPCHPLRTDDLSTVMNAVVACYPETALVGDKRFEGGLIHRLDNGTSGALIIARSQEAFSSLRDAIRNNRIERHYSALAANSVIGTIEIGSPIAHHQKNPRRMIVAPPGMRSHARPAATVVEAIEHLRGFTLLVVKPRTGRRHQIRVHLASVGLPLAGDLLYGGPALPELAAGRFWLHLSAVAFESPASGRIEVTAPLPTDVTAVLERLRTQAP